MNRTSGRSWTRKFRCAFRGIACGYRGQDSFRVHLPLALLVIALALFLRVSVAQFGLLLLCITLVLTAEYFNSSLEWLAKAIDERHNQNLGNALDIASAAVLTASAGAAVVGVLVFVARCVELWLELS